MPDHKSIKPYTGPAGGLDALRRSLQALREEHITAFGAKTLLRTNQAHGFDCPGCAWPDRNQHSTFEFCENGVKAVAAEATRKRVTREFFAEHSVEWLAQQDDRFLEAQGRLTEPMAYDAATGHYVPVTWDAAFARIAAALHVLPSPDAAAFYTSGRTSNEAAFLYQLFVRAFGTNNLPDCSNLCHEASGIALTAQIGSGKGSVLLEDFTRAQAIFVFGQNPGTNHPRMLGELRDAAKRGCRIVVFNPLRERGLERFASPQHAADMLTGGVDIASHYYQLRIGGDLAAVTGLCKALLAWHAEGDADAVDHAFIDAHTTGYADFAASIEAADWAGIEADSGLSRAQLEQAARVYRDSDATIVCWGMGITQHRRSVATIQLLMDLLLLRGNVGKPGAGPCPVRGHSNVQGDRTMGIHEKPDARFLDRLAAEFEFEPPRVDGLDVVGAIAAMERGDVQVFFALGGNFAQACPDTARTHAALRKCALTAHVSTKLNRSHLVHGAQALILPCLGRSEVDVQADGPQAVSVEDSMSMVHLSEGMNAPASTHLLSEPAIVARLADATLGPLSTIPWLRLIEDYDRIRARIERVVDGFAGFNDRVRADGGFHLRHPAREREFPTATGKARFFAHVLKDVGATSVAMLSPESDKSIATDVAPTAKPDLLRLMTIRSHDQYNTTIYGLDDRYRGVRGYRRVLFISATDLARLGLADGEFVDVHSVWHDGERTAPAFRLVEYNVPAGCLAAYFPETNALVPLDSVAEHARTPTSKDIPVRLARRPPPEVPA